MARKCCCARDSIRPNSAAEGQVLRLSRYRSARVGVDVNLHTGRFTFDEAVRYFMQAGGLDREAATGEAAGAAFQPIAEDLLHHRQMADHATFGSATAIVTGRTSGSAPFTIS